MLKHHTESSEVFGSFLDIRKEVYPTSSIDFVTNRVLSYWIQKGILDPINGKGIRRKISFLELIWLKLVTDLRAFETGLDVIRKIKETLFEEVDINDADDSTFVGQDYIFERLGNQGPLSAKSLKSRSILMSPIYKELKAEISTITILEIHILQVIGMRSPVSLILTKDGRILSLLECFLEEYLQHNKFLEVFRESHMSISISTILKYFIAKADFNFPYSQIFISPEEAKILETLKNKNADLVEIKYKDGKPDIIYITKNNYLDVNSRVSDLLLNNGYETLKIKTLKGQIVNYSKTKAIKIKDTR